MITKEWLGGKIKETERVIETSKSNLYAVCCLNVRLLAFKEVLAEYNGVAFDMKREHTISMVGIERYNELQMMKTKGAT